MTLFSILNGKILCFCEFIFFYLILTNYRYIHRTMKNLYLLSNDKRVQKIFRTSQCFVYTITHITTHFKTCCNINTINHCNAFYQGNSSASLVTLVASKRATKFLCIDKVAGDQNSHFHDNDHVPPCGH